jgi:hypothetical protein
MREREETKGNAEAEALKDSGKNSDAEATQHAWREARRKRAWGGRTCTNGRKIQSLNVSQYGLFQNLTLSYLPIPDRVSMQETRRPPERTTNGLPTGLDRRRRRRSTATHLHHSPQNTDSFTRPPITLYLIRSFIRGRTSSFSFLSSQIMFRLAFGLFRVCRSSSPSCFPLVAH